MAESLSVSQFKSFYEELGGCRYGWKLKKVDKVRQTPAAWLPQGTGVHAAWEAWELSDREMSLEQCEEVFGRTFDEEVTRLCEETPNLDHWFSSGRYYPAELDIPRRYQKGMDQVGTWIDHYTRTRERPIRIDGKAAVETPFELELDSGVKVRGYIDAVFPDVVDGKTGNNPPKDAEGQEDPTQLGVYKVALEEQYDIRTDTGYYFMASKAKPVAKVHNLKGWTIGTVTDMFGQLAADIDAERFEPSPSPEKCRTCTVQHACPFVMV